MGINRGPCCEPDLVIAVGDFITFLYPSVRILSSHVFISDPELQMSPVMTFTSWRSRPLQHPRPCTYHVILPHLLQNEFPFPEELFFLGLLLHLTVSILAAKIKTLPSLLCCLHGFQENNHSFHPCRCHGDATAPPSLSGSSLTWSYRNELRKEMWNVNWSEKLITAGDPSPHWTCGQWGTNHERPITNVSKTFSRFGFVEM